MKIEILRGKSGQWYWRMIAINGQIVANSETYSSRQKAIKTVESIVGAIGLVWKVLIQDKKHKEKFEERVLGALHNPANFG